MTPRFRADRRTVLWMLVLAPITMAVQYIWPHLIGYLTPLSLYFGVSAAVIAHNHNHCPTFVERRANTWFGNVLSIFYGYPTFAWIPTHNLNHHKLVNRAGDATITWRLSNRHNLLLAVTYFFVSAYHQRIPTAEFVRRAREGNPRLLAMIRQQTIFWATTNLGLLAIALAVHGPGAGLRVW